MLISMGTTLICEIIEIIFNLMIIIIIYPLIRKLGEKLEQVFNEDKILTKYF